LTQGRRILHGLKRGLIIEKVWFLAQTIIEKVWIFPDCIIEKVWFLVGSIIEKVWIWGNPAFWEIVAEGGFSRIIALLDSRSAVCRECFFMQREFCNRCCIGHQSCSKRRFFGLFSLLLLRISSSGG
jgi:hypothetical protein